MPLSGTLDDGDFTLRLKGFYDEESGVFSLSATSSVIKYSISGTAKGGATASVATRASADVPFSAPVFVEVSTEVSGADLTDNIARGEDTPVVAGLDLPDCFGVWYNEAAPSLIKYIVNDWGMTMAYNEGSGWIESSSVGFSEITDKTGSFDIVADFTTIEWVPPRDPADFPAYLIDEGWKPVLRDVYEKTPEVRDHSHLFVLLPGYDQQNGGLPIATTGGTYVTDIMYDTTGTFHGSTEKPFVVEKVYKVGDNGWAPLEEDAFATFEEAVTAAQAAIRERSGDNTAVITLPPEYTTKYIKLSIFVWANIPRGIATDEQWIAFYEKMAPALHDYDSEEYPDPDKIIFESSPEYFDLLTEWLDVPNFETVTKYVKWNFSHAGANLVAKAYYSGTPDFSKELWYLDDPVYVKDNFAEAKALTALPEQNQNTISNGSFTTMIR